MTDLELLEHYEPTLRFAKSERFFPMAVEPYLEQCALFPSGPEGAFERFGQFNESLSASIGRLKSEQFYLRFVNRSLYRSDAWLWLPALSLIGLIVGWLALGKTGIEIDLALSFLVALLLFMLASPVRLRIIPSVVAVSAFCGLSLAPIWFFLNPNEYVGFAVEYLILLPLYVAALFYALIRILKFTIDRIIPEGPGMIMDMLSRATERVAQAAYEQYAEILKKESQPVYYGRVLHETDKENNRWTILQYHFFYAFNDWRLAANGMNHHEGDWELVAVYLKNNAPYAVLFSQHGAGNIASWADTLRVKDKSGRNTTHPIVYVALGSHANYGKPGVLRSPDMYAPGKAQRVMFWLDGFIHYLFLLVNPDQKARQIALQGILEQHGHILDEKVLLSLRDETDHYVVRLPMEMATGDGYRVGPHEEAVKEQQTQSSKVLKRALSRRKVTHPQADNWRRILLNSTHDWVQYKGLWGVKSWLGEESGPPGPRWERPKKKQTSARERVRWGNPLKWLEQLENRKH